MAQRAADVAKLKLSKRAEALAALPSAPLAQALKARAAAAHRAPGCVLCFMHPLTRGVRTHQAYFEALRLEARSDNAARFDHASLRALFAQAYRQLAGGAAYAGGIDWAADDAAEPRSAGKRVRAPAAPEPAAEAEAEAAAPKRGRRAAVPAPAQPARVTRARAAAQQAAR
jgi:hypothetical protein